MKIFDVECPVHGRYEMIVHDEHSDELFCEIKINLKRCGERLKKHYPTPNVHFKGDGFTKTSRQK